MGVQPLLLVRFSMQFLFYFVSYRLHVVVYRVGLDELILILIITYFRYVGNFVKIYGFLRKHLSAFSVLVSISVSSFPRIYIYVLPGVRSRRLRPVMSYIKIFCFAPTSLLELTSAARTSTASRQRTRITKFGIRIVQDAAAPPPQDSRIELARYI